MDPVEKIYRDNPSNPVKARQYVKMLLRNEHFLEADYYFDKLIKLDPKGYETNKLGFNIAINMRRVSVSEFEINLKAAGICQEHLYALHLHYYFTFSEKKMMRDCALGLIDYEPTETHTVKILYETIVHLEDFDLANKFVRYILPKISIPENAKEKLRKIILKRLLFLIELK